MTDTETTTLIDHLSTGFPHAETLHGHGPNSAVIAVTNAETGETDGYIVLTEETECPPIGATVGIGRNTYLVGIYTAECWEQGSTDDGDAATFVDIRRDNARAFAFVDYLTSAQPEGTDWHAWATQRIDDAGEHADGAE